MSDRKEFIQSLRDLAEFYEHHSGVPLPLYPNVRAYVSTREELIEACRELGHFTKDFYGDRFAVERQFGSITLVVTSPRTVVCKRVVKGQRWVPPSEGHHVDAEEWVCDEPLLKEDASREESS